jgi:lipopolysaccharide/colanic/teichoic acid biosynthesis glycosyltransferase
VKRLFDITVALVALLLLCLPLLALTLLVRRKLGRPAFFRQVSARRARRRWRG